MAMTRSSREQWMKRAALIGCAFITLMSVIWIYAPLGTWAWESAVPRSFPAVRLVVDPSVSSVTLYVDEQEPAQRFHVAGSEAAVRSWWLYVSSPETVQDLVACDGDKDDDALKCNRTGNAIRITLPPPAATGGPRERARTLWVIPHQVTERYKTVHVVTPVRWTRIELARADGSVDVSAASCAKGESDKEEACLLAEELLGRAHLNLSRNPQNLVGRLARETGTRIVPAIVGGMLILDGALALFLAYLVGRWALGKGLAPRSMRGTLVDATTVWGGVRRFLEAVEVLGPAMGFSLTVFELTRAFDPSVFAERDGTAFSTAISIAMGATFAGLVARIVAFASDRMIEHLARWHADDDGLIPVEKLEGALTPMPGKQGRAPRHRSAAGILREEEEA